MVSRAGLGLRDSQRLLWPCRGQYHLVMKYLSEMTDEQTLVMYSGHPLGYAAAVTRQSPMMVLTRALVWS